MFLRLSSSIKLQIKNCFRRGDTLYWQRKVPKDLEDRYGGSKVLKINLNTTDLGRAAKLIEGLNKQHESLWDSMRGNQSITPASVHAQALLLLKKYGLSPYSNKNDEMTVDHFIDSIFEPKRIAAAKAEDNPEEAYKELTPEDYASQVEVKALEILTTPPRFCLSDAVQVYLDGHKKKNDETFRRYTERTWNKLIDTVGNKPFDELTRADANAFRDTVLATGSKTTTVHRQIKGIAAVCAAVILEREMERTNPFKSIKIGGLSEDAEVREPLTKDELDRVAKACLAKDDDIRWLLAIQIDIGSRLAEVAGLALDDLVIDAETPHVVIKPHPWRSLKTKNSTREVPLTGLALWAAKRIKETATQNQQMAFPRYCSPVECKTTSASNTINEWMARMKIEKTTHCLRHTMVDRCWCVVNRTQIV